MASSEFRGVNRREMFRRLHTVFQSKFDSKEKIVVAGTSRAASSLVSTFGDVEAQCARVDQLRANLHQAVVERDAVIAQHSPLAQACISSLEVHWGNSPEKLADAGIPPRKQKRPLTTEERYAATVKARRTRELRNTKGKRQKAKIKATGTVNISSELVPSGSSSGGGATTVIAQGNGAAPSASHANEVVPAVNGVNPVSGAAI